MGISINSVTLDPQNITPPNTGLKVSYDGFVDSAADNPVTITMTLETGTKVYIGTTATDKQTTLKWTDNLPIGTTGIKTKALFVGISPPDSGKTCSASFHFQPKSGGAGDDELTHFNL